jgi:transglutaminase-like putative cysteine protease
VNRDAAGAANGSGLAAFAGLSALAAWRYAGIEAHPPTGRVVAIAAVAVVVGVGMMLIQVHQDASRRARALATVARAIALAALFAIAMLAAGVPAHLLRPADWGRLAHGLHGGLQTVASTLWPYEGRDSWARLDLLLAFAAVGVAAAALGFWPAGRTGPTAMLRYRVRHLAALALLLALYVVGVIDSNGGSATVEGLVLLALVAAWLWLPGLRVRRLLAALAWLAVAGAIAAAVAAPLMGGQPWLNYRAWDLLGTSGPGITFSWDQSYGPIHWSRSQRTVFTVRSPGPQLWRTTTLDRFDGLRFVRSGTDPVNDGDLPLPVSWYTSATFTITGLSSALLPTEGGTIAGVNIGDPVHRNQDGTAQTLGPALRRGDTYTVLSYVPQPAPSELRAAPRAFPAAYLRYTDFDLPTVNQSGRRLAATDPQRPGRFFSDRTVGAPAPGLSPVAVPATQRRILASPYGPMYRLARRLASGRRSSYDVAEAIASYLKANYTYSEQTTLRRYPLESFLFVDRAGYCQQFSGAMTLMLRMDGIPARVAGGFLPGPYDSATGTYQVRAVDAHSWVEVYFGGIGWVPFDPTPPRPVGPVQSLPRFPSERTVSALDAFAATVASLPQYAGQRIPTVRGRGAAGSADVLIGAMIAAAFVGLLVLAAIAVRYARGLLRLRQSLAGDGQLASLELQRALRRLGYAVPATVTLAQIEQLVRVHGGTGAARYAGLLRDRRYAAGPGATATLRDRRRLRLGLTAHLGLDARLRGLWALPPGTVAWRI